MHVPKGLIPCPIHSCFFFKILDPKRSMTDFNIFVMVVIAHGSQGDIIMSADGKRSVTVSEIILKLDAMEDLRGKPKALIMESCRGGSYNNGFEVQCKHRLLLLVEQ
jgi:hypothetical protein